MVVPHPDHVVPGGRQVARVSGGVERRDAAPVRRPDLKHAASNNDSL